MNYIYPSENEIDQISYVYDMFSPAKLYQNQI